MIKIGDVIKFAGKFFRIRGMNSEQYNLITLNKTDRNQRLNSKDHVISIHQPFILSDSPSLYTFTRTNKIFGHFICFLEKYTRDYFEERFGKPDFGTYEDDDFIEHYEYWSFVVEKEDSILEVITVKWDEYELKLLGDLNRVSYYHLETLLWQLLN